MYQQVYAVSEGRRFVALAVALVTGGMVIWFSGRASPMSVSGLLNLRLLNLLQVLGLTIDLAVLGTAATWGFDVTLFPMVEIKCVFREGTGEIGARNTGCWEVIAS